MTLVIELVDENIITTSNHKYLPYAQEGRRDIENVNQRHKIYKRVTLIIWEFKQCVPHYSETKDII